MDVDHKGIDKGTSKAILVVSFGTSHRKAGEAAFGSIERRFLREFPDCEIRRAYTSRMILDRLKKQGGTAADSVGEALERLSQEGFAQVVVQPTYVMEGYEYEQMAREILPYEGRFGSVRYGAPLIRDEADYEEIVEALAGEAGEYRDGRTAVVCVGHGTAHPSNAVYVRLDDFFKGAGYPEFFVGTVEAAPALGQVAAAVADGGYERVVLLPLLTVAGEHAAKDITGDQAESWKSVFQRQGCEVLCVLKGLGEYPGIQKIFVRHVREAYPAAFRHTL